MKEPQSFDLALKSVPVKIGTQSCSVVELTGTQRDQYMDLLRGTTKMVFDEVTKTFRVAEILSQSGVIIQLVQMSLLNSEGKNFDLATVKTWPARVIDGLSDIVREVSGLDDDSDKKEASIKKE